MTTPQIDDGGPVHPATFKFINEEHAGISKLEHFAGLAMQAILGGEMVVTCNDIAKERGVIPALFIAETSYEMASAMIAAGKTKP